MTDRNSYLIIMTEIDFGVRNGLLDTNLIDSILHKIDDYKTHRLSGLSVTTSKPAVIPAANTLPTSSVTTSKPAVIPAANTLPTSSVTTSKPAVIQATASPRTIITESQLNSLLGNSQIMSVYISFSAAGQVNSSRFNLVFSQYLIDAQKSSKKDKEPKGK